MSAISYPHSNRRSQPSLIVQIGVALLIGILLFILAAGAAVTGFELWYGGRIYPGVSIAGIDVSGLSPQAAAVRLAEQFTYPQTGRILLQEGQNAWLVAPGEIGLYLDPENSAELAYSIGRQGGLGQRLAAQAGAYSNGTSISPVLIFDQRAAYQYIANLAKEIDTPVIEAALGLQGSEIVVNSGQRGRVVDVEATLAQLSAQVQSLTDGVVTITVDETEPIILDATVQAEKARQILSQPLTLTLPDGDTSAGPWTFDQPTLAAMLSIERKVSSGIGSYEVGLSSGMLISYLSNLAPELQRYAQNARFIFNDDTGQLDVKDPSIRGRTLDVEATLKAIRDGLDRGEHTIPLQFVYQEPQVADTKTGEELGITELVHAESTYFYGSSGDRIHNIKTAASRFHGLLIAPGETFSMATALGDISLDNGYAEALIIVGDQTVQGVGGGVCQVSTTLFRAAFFAGFPIVERHSHAYRVSYYEKVYGNRIETSFAGMDATVFVPIVDFKFTNDTPHWLLMETYVSDVAITWKFYSTKDGRSVDWDTTGPINTVEPPPPLYKENPSLGENEFKQVDWAAQGSDVSVTRTVFRNGEVYFNDSFFTHYQPWRAIYEYGPGSDLPEDAVFE